MTTAAEIPSLTRRERAVLCSLPCDVPRIRLQSLAFIAFVKFRVVHYAEGVRCRRTTELSDSRRQARWSARGASELPPSVERRSGAAVRSRDLVRRRYRHQKNLKWIWRPAPLVRANSLLDALNICDVSSNAAAARFAG
jgi:hypothetical protein